MTDYEFALSKAQKYCSTKEVCIYDIIQKLNEWGIDTSIHKNVVEQLLKDKFIDEQRYANAFASDKLLFNNWGKIKIRFFLTQKKIAKNHIDNALNNLDNELYYSIARKLIVSKIKSLKQTDSNTQKQKILLFMSSKGFEKEIVNEIIKNLK